MREPDSTRSTLAPISALISFAAFALRCASAHLARDDREAAALIAGTRRFDGRVQREDVGLERDPVDHADDVGDLVRTRGDVVHRRDHFVDRLPAAHGRLARRHRQLVGLQRRLRVARHGGRHLGHRRGRLLDAGRRLFGARAQVVVALRDLVARALRMHLL
jgi:hypothetical protein